jgi:hypothetical protein
VSEVARWEERKTKLLNVQEASNNPDDSGSDIHGRSMGDLCT